MHQGAHMFQRLKATEKIKSHITHNIDKKQDLCEELETTKAIVATTWKTAKEEASLMRKMELENALLCSAKAKAEE